MSQLENQLTENFRRSEFACRCGCGFDTVDVELVRGLQALRTLVGKPILIISGCRCYPHNERVSGAKTSQHCLGRAADIYIRDMSPDEIFKIARTISAFRGFGVGSNICHLDSRSGMRAFWRYNPDGSWRSWRPDDDVDREVA